MVKMYVVSIYLLTSQPLRVANSLVAHRTCSARPGRMLLTHQASETNEQSHEGFDNLQTKKGPHDGTNSQGNIIALYATI